MGKPESQHDTYSLVEPTVDPLDKSDRWKAPRLRRLDDLPRRRILNCSFDELVETSWEKAWRPDP